MVFKHYPYFVYVIKILYLDGVTSSRHDPTPKRFSLIRVPISFYLPFFYSISNGDRKQASWAETFVISSIILEKCERYLITGPGPGREGRPEF
jgi:hypothetical protein